MRSINFRLLLGCVTASLLVLSSTGVALYLAVASTLQSEFDESLTSKARALASRVEWDHHRVELEIDDRILPEFSRQDRPEYFQLQDSKGATLYRSRSLPGDLSLADQAASSPVCRALTLPDGRPGRMAQIAFEPRHEAEDERAARADAPPPQLALAVARETAGLDHTLAWLRRLLMGLGVGATLLSAAVLKRVVRQGLRPLISLADQIDQMGADDLARRISLPQTPIELAPVVARLNELMQRLQAAFQREKAFTADVAHELRTPLAGLRSTLEVSLAQPREAAAYQTSIRDTLEVALQMERMVDNLLCLARTDAGTAGVRRERVAIGDLLKECWSPCADRATERRLQVRWPVPTGGTLSTDREQLRHVLYNIFDNAVTYADTYGTIDIEWCQHNGQATLRVANSGSKLSADQASHVFEPFWRGDASRADTGVHSGLGMPLVKKLMTRLGGEVRVESTAGGTFAITLCFPLNEPTASGRSE